MSRAPIDTRQFAILRERQAARIEAMGRLEGRCLLDIEEQMGHCMKWPYRFTEMMLSRHLRFPERWQLTLFLLGNRCPPSLFAEWYVKRGMLHDKSARDQVIDIIKKHKSGELEQQGRSTWVMDAMAPPKPVWDRKHPWDGVGEPAEDKNQIIATPTFAFDWEHQWHWDEAIKTLQMPQPAIREDGSPAVQIVEQIQKRQRVAAAASSSTPPPRPSKTELAQTWAAEMRTASATAAAASSDDSPIAEALATRRFLAP